MSQQCVTVWSLQLQRDVSPAMLASESDSGHEDEDSAEDEDDGHLTAGCHPRPRPLPRLRPPPPGLEQLQLQPASPRGRLSPLRAVGEFLFSSSRGSSRSSCSWRDDRARRGAGPELSSW